MKAVNTKSRETVFGPQDTLNALEKLYAQQSLSFVEAEAVFNRVMRGEVSEVELSALLIALKIKTESIEEIAGAASAMVSNAKPFPRPEYNFSDIVGTGGDGHNTINVSSAAAVVAASCGVKVAKHGNRSVSSKSGSSDLFAAFGLALDMSPDTARKCLDEANLCFLAAPAYHSGVKYAMPVRLALKTRTLFNILGPLANPARPTHSLLGVYTPSLLDTYAQTLVALGHKKAFVVHGSGLDELALHGNSQIVEVNNGAITKSEVTPADFGLSNYSLNAIEGGEPEQNRALIADVFNGQGTPAHTAAIAMNAAALIKLNAMANTFKEACDMAMASIEAGKPMQTIETAAKLSQM
ncbi:anthranilate phosphoribosyltransferase [Brumicola nitratireducens]|uniref:Anthranilate phosphoribosyltransferase n=1 Tax=Glaciecola nitratireducens (strain JCM 12485 / KCTC 12276 / FR1064) TaxID=1085623 RepID=G4QL83_GLANF|nr:anthranilate phosphoribosyltransferase [Glaciecola nitratireducens]AEP29554.1 anthranilate phosphoribosyltransferase [Glaciecola nitratireducens FR1064]